MFKLLKIQLGICLIAICCSCNKWIDVEPKDRITDEMLFSTKDGYVKALNGIYAELNSSSLYGRDLTMGMMDAMAQYYNTAISEHAYIVYANYTYGNDIFKGKLSTIWAKSYTLIANANVIVDKCGTGNSVLPDNYYRLVKGEALALRAMLHFDLLRMFGPIYNEAGKQIKCIPYITTSDRSIQPLLTAEEVLAKVTEDLLAAKALLETVDPVIKLGALNGQGTTNNDFTYRQYRLNYFAVNALLARKSLWAGDKAGALTYAREVISAAQAPGAELFPFITLEGAKPSSPNRMPDRVFSTEVLFAGYNTSRLNTYNALFANTLNVTQQLTFPGNLTNGRVALLYDNQNDYRKAMWEMTTVNSREVLYLTKYQDVSDNDGFANNYRYMVPLIRISEMHLIVAECATDLATAGKAINNIRLHRACIALPFTTEEEVKTQIALEYIREFIGEGQLFYYFKRKALTSIPDGNRIAGGVIPMQLGNYVFPLPENETSQRQ